MNGTGAGVDDPSFRLTAYATGTGAPARDRRADNASTTGVTGGFGDAPTVVSYRSAGNEVRDALRSGDYRGPPPRRMRPSTTISP